MQTSWSEAEQIQSRFNRLIRELLEGKLKRNAFTPWEIDLLLDMESCTLGGRHQKDVLRRYQRAVNRQLEKEPSLPMKLSEYLTACQRRHARQRSESN